MCDVSEKKLYYITVWHVKLSFLFTVNYPLSDLDGVVSREIALGRFSVLTMVES